MKKCEKGTPGYLDYKKKAEIIRTIIYFAIVLAILLLGYSQTHTKKNYLTIVAILGCLPSSKALVGVITRLPYKSVDISLAKDVQEKTAHLTTVFDLVITSEKKIMPVTCVVVSGDKIFGYAPSEKVDLNYAAAHIKNILVQNQFSHVSVKLFHDYKAFLSRAEGLENIASVEKADTKEHEEAICQVIKNISL